MEEPSLGRRLSVAASKKTICGAFSARSLAVLAGVCLTLTLQASASGARASSLSSAVQGSGPVMAGAQSCAPDWQVVSSPNIGYDNHLYAVSALSPGSAWAVGYWGTTTMDRTLTQHWDGTHWSIVNSPNPNSEYNHLYGVEAVSTNDVRAVGAYTSLDGAGRTLVVRWNGSAWTVVPSPNVEQQDNFLSGVAVVSAGDVWAVGHSGGSNAQQTLTEHWNGSKWSIVPS